MIVLSVPCVLSGCFLAHGLDDDPRDAGPPIDGPRWDVATEGPCGLVGGYLPCDGDCAREYDVGEGRTWACPERNDWYCSDELGVCYEWVPHTEPRGNNVCDVSYGSPTTGATYCYSGLCASRPEADFSETSFRGSCVRPEFCAEVSATELGTECRYSDGTPYVNGPPPLSECPAGNELTPFCGGPCDPSGCPFTVPPVGPRSNWEVACIGLSETRGVGVCAVHSRYNCGPGGDEHVTANRLMREGCPLYWGQECLCIVQRDAEGLRDWGWVTMADSCRAYREMYPGDVECFDADFRRVD